MTDRLPDAICADTGALRPVILPGGIATDKARSANPGWDIRGPITQPGRIPLTRTSSAPAEIAKAALFFADGASAYVTGQLLSVDGGFRVS